jgi:cytochrome c oxidase assembly protein subunit 19
MSFNARKGGKNAQAKPPEKGAFPLDHGGECARAASEFMACLKQHAQRHAPCKALAKRYFECRMDRGLMAKEDLSTMGFSQHQLRQVHILSSLCFVLFFSFFFFLNT